ncbi:hypothetical protein SAMN06295973_0607 [Plantibacter cousiniae]|uniref:Pycsar effector protein domain-containing protein n=2 Tax=Plantibacter cousiniae (nom. nud.) TaxID=199709 RepID=A0ABY1LH83_9MICO|nr:hypothetical protein SAMN06295973_0607 [Plantibacter cousiniae]
MRHSDAKAGVTLAFTGALGAMLFNLVKEASHRSVLFDVCVVLGCILLLVTASFCARTLIPRVDDRDADPETINRLFFASISRHFDGERLRYAQVLSTLTSDPQELVNDLAHQIHANAKIATVKASYAKWAIRSALASGASVAAVALIIGLSSF